MSLVLDCSMTIAWLLPDESTTIAEKVLDRITDAGAVVPPLWFVEVANVLTVAVRRQRISREQRAEFLRNLAGLGLIVDQEAADQIWSATVGLADLHQLSVYDATYLELAQRRRLPLATLDKALRDAAQKSGVGII